MKIKLELHKIERHYEIKILINHTDFSIDFISSGCFAKSEATYRIIQLAAMLNAGVDLKEN